MSRLAITLVGFLNALLGLTLVAMTAAWIWTARRWRAGRPLLPPYQPARVPWGGRTLVAVVATYVFINLLVVDGYVILTRRPPRLPFTYSEQLVLTALINGFLLTLLPVLLREGAGARARDLGLSRSGLLNHIRTGALGFLIVTPVVLTLQYVCVHVWEPHQHPLEQLLRAESVGAGSVAQLAYLALLTAVVLAPAAEELIFRGILQNWLETALQRRSVPPNEEGPPSDHSTAQVGSVVLTALAFAAVHVAQWPAPIPIFFLALALGWIYQRTRSLVAPIVMHALFNGLSTVVLILALLGGRIPAPNAVPPRACVESRATLPTATIPTIGAPDPADAKNGHRSRFLVDATPRGCYSCPNP